MRIGVDMDGVLADFTGKAIVNIKKRFGIDVAYDDINIPRIGDLVYGYLPEEEQAKFDRPRDLYKEICPAGFFENINAYEGVIETLKILHKLHDVVIVTKPLEWENCPGEKYTWLNKHLGFKPKLILVNSMEAKGMIDVDVMIDDDPRVLKSLSSATGIAVRRPWNKEFLKFEAFREVDSFNEVLDIVTEIATSFYSIE